MFVSSIIHNSQKVERTQMYINGQMDKQNVIQAYSGYYLAIKRNEGLICATTWMNLEKLY